MNYTTLFKTMDKWLCDKRETINAWKASGESPEQIAERLLPDILDKFCYLMVYDRPADVEDLASWVFFRLKGRELFKGREQ